jgi:transcriptional regulator with GAF, ATPase, and Fis domain
MNITCSALPEQLLESELFGHERGAFTDARMQKRGLLESADGGTVFLDEIGEMVPALQAKLLRVLEEKSFKRVGGAADIRVDVRVVAATNRNLEEQVAKGSFRSDLYYRLNVLPIRLPPLREHAEDVPGLAHFFVDTFSREFKKRISEVSPAASALLKGYGWPGNVRELRNVIERAILLSEHPASEAALKRNYIPGQTGSLTPSSSSGGSAPSITPSTSTVGANLVSFAVDIQTPFKSAKQALVTEFERRYIGALLAEHDGNISAAARAAGIDRMSIHKMLHRLGIDNPGRRE